MKDASALDTHHTCRRHTPSRNLDGVLLSTPIEPQNPEPDTTIFPILFRLVDPDISRILLTTVNTKKRHNLEEMQNVAQSLRPRSW